MSDPAYYLLLSMILLAGAIAAPTDKAEAASIATLAVGVFWGLAVGAWLLW